MSMNDKLRSYIEAKKTQLQRGVEVSEQMKAEKVRKKLKRAESYEPGTFRYGLAMKQGTRNFMKDVYEKRKREREKKG